MGQAPLGFFIVLALPGLLNLFAAVSSQPVQAQVRGAEVTTREISCNRPGDRPPSLFPWVFSRRNSLLTMDDQRPLVVWFFLAFFSYVAACAEADEVAQPQSPTRSLRANCATARLPWPLRLASSCNSSMSCRPPKTRVANAYARTGNSVMLTDYLLQHLSKRE